MERLKLRKIPAGTSSQNRRKKGSGEEASFLLESSIFPCIKWKIWKKYSRYGKKAWMEFGEWGWMVEGVWDGDGDNQGKYTAEHTDCKIIDICVLAYK